MEVEITNLTLYCFNTLVYIFALRERKKNQRQEAEIYVAPFSRLNIPLTEKRELNKSNV